MRFVASDGVVRLADALASQFDLFAPREVDGKLVLARLSEAVGDRPPPAWNAFRLPDSLKPLWFQSGKILSRWTRDGPVPGPVPRPRAVFGAKACDLRALAILDRVLREHDFKEPAWCAAREQNFIVAGDCSDAAPSCFCTMFGEQPWPRDGYDLSLSPVDGGFILVAGSERGQEVLEAALPDAPPPTRAQTAERDEIRAALQERIIAQNEQYATHDPFETSIEKQLRTRIWGRLAATCVECNACNIVCPTCHCFLLFDRAEGAGAVRFSQWDSCFHAGYARMAGGGTPRLQLVERFKNHYFHKFVSFPRNWGMTACTGCGRCIDACMGRIDKRACLRRLETEWMPSEVLADVE
ncbi:MAG: 4Fe-4S dicluster domain-containing protein [Planctomycetes bacterium]|nr:4Fe-4S dicluster domain-containing protein [Planctomycetota bacterium]